MRVNYLVLFPKKQKIEAGGEKNERLIKRAPYFLDLDIDIQKLTHHSFKVLDTEVKQEVYLYDDLVFVLQFEYEIGPSLTEEVFELKNKLNLEFKDIAISNFGADPNLVEEYTILLEDKPGKIKEFLEKNEFSLARFIRSLEKKVNKADAEDILVSQVSYSKEDVAIVDWEGAILADPEGDFDSQIELLKIGNYQLVRYRILDQKIEKSLEDIRHAVNGKGKKVLGNVFVRSAIENKLSLLLDFDKVDQSILLVGDWYSSNLYRAIMQEFYIDDWRDLIKNKLENLEAIDATAREHIVFDWNRILDIVQLVGWLVLLVGYIYLYFKDAGLF